MILSAAFAVALIFALPAAVSAEPDTDAAQTQTRGVYWFGTHEVGEDLTDTYIFDDSLLTGDSKPLEGGVRNSYRIVSFKIQRGDNQT